MRAPYFLAIDVGTTRTSAAISRRSAEGGPTVGPVPLGRHSDHSSTAVFVGESGLLFGDAAERRGLTQPERLVREFKRRIGDDVPVMAGDQSFTAEQLFAHVVTWVAETVAEREGHSPSGITVTVPATWGEYRTQRVAAAIAHEGWHDVQLVSEPEAAARHYDHVNPLETGRALAVYDLGGGTFDAVVVRKDKKGALRIVSPSTGLADVGGADFDDLLLRHVMTAAGITDDVLRSDPGSRVALGALRRECVDAKESLSFDSEAVIPVLIGGRSTSVRVTRAEFEAMIETRIERTTDALEQAIEAASLRADRLAAVLLVGGSSRIPRVAQMLSERIDTTIAVDADPKAVVAFGAARAAAARFDDDEIPEERARVVVEAETDTAEDLLGLDEIGHAPAPHPRQKSRVRWFGRGPATAAVTVGAVVLACGVVLSSVSAIAGGAAAEEAPIFAAGSGANAFFDDAIVAEGLSRSGVTATVDTPFGTDEPITAVPVIDAAAPATPGNASKPKSSTSSKSKSNAKAATKSSGSSPRSDAAPSNPGSNSNGSSAASQPQNPPASGSSGTPTAPSPSTPTTTTPTTPPSQEPSTPPTTDPTQPPVTQEPTPSDPPPTTDPTPSDPPPTQDPSPSDPPPPAEEPTTTETPVPVG